MARSTLEECMFCGSAPCQCYAPKKPSKKVQAPKPVAPPAKEEKKVVRIPKAPTVQTSVGTESSELPKRPDAVREGVKRHALKPDAAVRDEDRELSRAIGCFVDAGLVDERSLLELRAEFKKESSLQALLWRARLRNAPKA